jgi:hypothetical protein
MQSYTPTHIVSKLLKVPHVASSHWCWSQSQLYVRTGYSMYVRACGPWAARTTAGKAEQQVYSSSYSSVVVASYSYPARGTVRVLIAYASDYILPFYGHCLEVRATALATHPRRLCKLCERNPSERASDDVICSVKLNARAALYTYRGIRAVQGLTCEGSTPYTAATRTDARDELTHEQISFDPLSIDPVILAGEAVTPKGNVQAT